MHFLISFPHVLLKGTTSKTQEIYTLVIQAYDFSVGFHSNSPGTESELSPQPPKKRALKNRLTILPPATLYASLPPSRLHPAILATDR